MSFEFFAVIGLVAFISGAAGCIVFYLWRIKTPRPSAYRYFGLAVVMLIASYLVGSFAGIGVMCASSNAGNLCGIWGALGSGPLLAGVSLWLYGPVYRKSTAR